MQSTFYNIEPKDMHELIANEKERIKWETRYTNLEVIREGSREEGKVLYGVLPKFHNYFADVMIKQRDFLIKAYSIKDGLGKGKYLNIASSLELPDVPHKLDYVRATLHLNAAVVEKNP